MGVILRILPDGRKRTGCATIPAMSLQPATVSLFASLVLLSIPPFFEAYAQEQQDIGATTELSCSFAMDKGQTGTPCHVPVPSGCQVAYIPGTTQPWTTILKGGQLHCRFDDKETDWKTKITGSCDRCLSVHCSAKFSVRFTCSSE